MSECVVRMKMPKCCDDCDAGYDCCACGISGEFWFRNPKYKEFDSSKERLPNCPIICQLPEGHGRLVDSDEIMQAIDEDIELDSRGLDDMYLTGSVRERLRMDVGYKNGFKEYMRKRPTVVPAERS